MLARLRYFLGRELSPVGKGSSNTAAASARIRSIRVEGTFYPFFDDDPRINPGLDIVTLVLVQEH